MLNLGVKVIANEIKQALLYLLVRLSMRAVIGLYGPLKFEVDSVAKLFCDLSPTVFNFYSK